MLNVELSANQRCCKIVILKGSAFWQAFFLSIFFSELGGMGLRDFRIMLKMDFVISCRHCEARSNLPRSAIDKFSVPPINQVPTIARYEAICI